MITEHAHVIQHIVQNNTNNLLDFVCAPIIISVMERFTAVVKSIFNADKSRTLKLHAEDAWIAHKQAVKLYNQLREDVVTIKDSKGHEVYNLEKGFIFES